jgi:hypothetical protein
LEQYTDPQSFEAGLLDMTVVTPLSATVTPGPPRLVILLPSITPQGLTGGPNTALQLGYRLAQQGTPVRFVSCDAPLPTDTAWFWQHLAQLTGLPIGLPAADLAAASHLQIGVDDLLLATYWTTAHQAASLLPQTARQTFLYLIQDFEPGFYAWSSDYAQAASTYDLPFKALINSTPLAEHLFAQNIGQFAQPGFRDRTTTFEPAVDRTVFRPAQTARNGKRRLLLYARPTNPRNMLGLAVASLRAAVAAGTFDERWEFLTLGARGSLPPISLGSGHMLREAPWRSYRAYADTLRTADFLLSPMLSPHTSYPVLEMVACGGLTVTNTHTTKTAAYLTGLSTNIIAVEPTVAGFVHGLAEAAERSTSPGPAAVNLPQTWDESFANVYATIAAELKVPAWLGFGGSIDVSKNDCCRHAERRPYDNIPGPL